MSRRNMSEVAADSLDENPLKFILGLILIFAAVGFAIWGISVVASPFFGAAEAHKQINSATNRIGQNDAFFQLDKDIRSQAQNAALAQKQLDAFNKTNPPAPGEGFQISEQRTNLSNAVTGSQQLCVQNVNEYNNKSVNYTAADFKAVNLPASFSPDVCTDPSKLPPSANPAAN
jgi:hypothetical protein